MSDALGNAGVVTLLAAIVTGLSGYGLARLNRPKIAADTRRVDADTETVAVHNAEKVVELLGKRLDRVEAEHAKCQDDIIELRSGRTRDRMRIARLEQALRVNGIAIPDDDR